MSELQDDFDPDELALKNNKPDVKMGLSSELDLDKTAPEDYDMKQTNDEFDSTINSEISELTSDAYDAWMGTDTKWRRSPEGCILHIEISILTYFVYYRW